MYKAIIAIGVAALACLIAGCGSSGDETAAAAVTKSQFIKQAEAICTKARAEAQDAAVAWEEAKGKRLDIDAALKQVIGPTLKQEVEQLQSLAVPAEDEKRLARMTENLSKVATAMMEGQNSGSASASASSAFRREAETYGLQACGI